LGIHLLRQRPSHGLSVSLYGEETLSLPLAQPLLLPQPAKPEATYVTQGPGSNPTVGTRLDALERNVSLIHERISGIEKEIDEESGKRLKRSRMKSTKDKQKTTLFARSLRPQGWAEYTSQLLEHHGFLSG
jgi:hypothetical protein